MTAERLLLGVTEQLKMPFLQIARLSELAIATSNSKEYLSDIESTAEAALRLLDSFMYSRELREHNEALSLEPVCVSSILQDAAHQLQQLAKRYDCDIRVHAERVSVPVLAHTKALQTAFSSLGESVIASQTMQSTGKRAPIVLGAYRSSHGVVAGVFGDMEGLSDKKLYAAAKLYGRAQQPLGGSIFGSGTGIYIADAIMSAMATRLRVAHHNHLPGLAATFSESTQLRLV